MNWLPHRPHGEKGDLTMQITVFAKKRTTEDGKFFYIYLTTLVNMFGEAKTASVKFRDTAGNPKPEQCPMNIKFDRADANLSSRKYVKTSGEEGESLTLWITSWVPGDVYEDHSLDDYDF